jgi:hypothetical protein
MIVALKRYRRNLRRRQRGQKQYLDAYNPVFDRLLSPADSPESSNFRPHFQHSRKPVSTPAPQWGQHSSGSGTDSSPSSAGLRRFRSNWTTAITTTNDSNMILNPDID